MIIDEHNRLTFSDEKSENILLQSAEKRSHSHYTGHSNYQLDMKDFQQSAAKRNNLLLPKMNTRESMTFNRE